MAGPGSGQAAVRIGVFARNDRHEVRERGGMRDSRRRGSGTFVFSAIAAVVAMGSWPPRASAQAADTSEPGSKQAIAAATTEPRFLSPWVADVPDHPTVPSPTNSSGTSRARPASSARPTKIYGYYRALAAATPRVRVETIGKSEEGREILLVAVGDERRLANLEGLRKDMADLADPRRCDEPCSEARIAGTTPSTCSTAAFTPRRRARPRCSWSSPTVSRCRCSPHPRDPRQAGRPHQPGGRARRA